MEAIGLWGLMRDLGVGGLSCKGAGNLSYLSFIREDGIA